MNLNYRAIANITGRILMVISATFALPAIVSLIYSEYGNAVIFLKTAAAAFIAGLILKTAVKPSAGPVRIREGFFIISLVWVLFSLIGALPFFVSGEIPRFTDAVFESCSGFTTTGATILTDIEAMSNGMLFWRSFTQWLGGIGVLIVAISVRPVISSGKQNLTLESTGASTHKKISKLSDATRQLYIIYLIFTGSEILLLMLGGMNLFDASIHTFGSVGTGGFSNYSDSIAHFDSLYIEIVIMLFMFLCGISFKLYFAGIRTGPGAFLGNSEFRLYALTAAAASVLVAADLIISGKGQSAGSTVADSVFQVISVLTTTGFTATDYNLWPLFAKAVLFMLFFIGGCSSSTAGGVKIMRIMVLLKLVKRSIGTRLHPNAVIKIKLKNNNLSNDLVSNVTSFVFLYIVLIAAGSLLVAVDNYDMTTTASAVISCIGNVGPGFNLVGPELNFSIFSGWSKCVLSFLMIAGRLELFAFLAFFIPHYWNPDRY